MSEAFEVIRQLMEALFPGCSGGGSPSAPFRNRVEQGASWGQQVHSASEFAPYACWLLRRGSAPAISADRLSLRCGHVLDDASVAAILCIPMIAQGETLGLFLLSTADPDALSRAKQQFAHTVAEPIALAIANLAQAGAADAGGSA